MGKKDSKKQKVEVPVKAKKAVVQPVEDSDDESSEEEEVQVKPQKQKGAKPVAKKAESSSEEEESSEEEAPVKNAAKAQESSSEEDDSEEEEAPKLNKQKVQLSKAAVVNQRVVGNKKPVVSKQDDDSSEDTSSEESSEEEVVKKVSTKRPSQTSKPVKKNAAPKKAAKESSEEEDSSEEEEEPSVPVKKAKATKPVKQAAKESSEEEDSDDDEEDSDDGDEDDSDEEEKIVKVPDTKRKDKNKKANEQPTSKKQKLKDDDEEDEVSENRKRKKEKANNEPTPKKQKIEAQNGSGEKITLFVGNLSKNTTEEDISAYFTENSITVAEVRKPPNKNNAFVDLEDAEELESALALNGTTLKKSTITVDKAKPRGQKEQNNQSFGSPGDRFSKGGDDDKDSRTLFVKNLPEDATVDGLGTVFDSAADIRLPQRDGVHKGFAFVEFADKESMESAMSEKQGADLNGSSLYLDYLGAKSKNQRGGGRGNDRRGRGGFDGGDRRGGGGNSGVRGESKVLFVKNLSYDTDESSLKSVFEGAVSARVPTFPDSGKPKGFAFVDFTSAEAAAEAYDNMNGQSIDGRQVTLDFAADKGSGGGGFGRGGGGGGFGGRGGGGRGGGFQRGGRGGGFGGRGRGGPRGGGGGFNKARGGIVQSEGRKTKFDDSD